MNLTLYQESFCAFMMVPVSQPSLNLNETRVPALGVPAAFFFALFGGSPSPPPAPPLSLWLSLSLSLPLPLPLSLAFALVSFSARVSCLVAVQPSWLPPTLLHLCLAFPI